MPKLFHDFADIEGEVKQQVSPTVYKYRNWSSDFHPTILMENSLWFSHPFDLNDPYDIRVPVRFNLKEIDTPEFFEVLKRQVAYRFPIVNPDSREFRVLCANKMDLILKDPQKHFEDNYLEMRESDLYDRVGVLSFSENPLSLPMWANYGNNGKGFCVGFNTVELVRSLGTAFGKVDYDDLPPTYSFLNPNQSEEHGNQMYLKHTKWGYEEEFRLLTFKITKNDDRSFHYPDAVLKEVILGYGISGKDREEIIKALQQKFESAPELFIVKADAGSFAFKREKIEY